MNTTIGNKGDIRAQFENGHLRNGHYILYISYFNMYFICIHGHVI